MPAFDPVRDAVLNSPVIASPSLQRRATDLAVLLNDNHDSPASTSYDNQHNDKLVDVSPLRRHSLFGESPISESKPLPSPLPPSMPSMPLPPRPSSLPYNPLKRITPPASVLIPLSPEETRMYKNYRGIGTTKLSKRKHSPTPESNLPPIKRLAGDVGVVVQHDVVRMPSRRQRTSRSRRSPAPGVSYNRPRPRCIYIPGTFPCWARQSS